MTDRKWIRGANGLWSSFDRTIRRQQLAQEARERLQGIADRFEVVMRRNGWERLRAGRGPWYRPS